MEYSIKLYSKTEPVPVLIVHITQILLCNFIFLSKRLHESKYLVIEFDSQAAGARSGCQVLSVNPVQRRDCVICSYITWGSGLYISNAL